MSSNTKKGKIYEGKVRKMVERIVGKPVHGEKVIPTKSYKGTRKVDMGIGDPSSEDYSFLEAKDWKSVTTVKAIDQTAGMKRAIQARSASVVSNSPYSENALNQAKFEGVKLYHYINPEDQAIKVGGVVKTYNSFIWISSLEYSCILNGNKLQMSSKPRTVLLDNDVSVAGLICELWNSGKLVMAEGQHTYTHEHFNMAADNTSRFPVDAIQFDYSVSVRNYIYEVQLSKGKGLFDVESSAFMFPNGESVFFGPMSIDKIMKEENLTALTPIETGCSFIGTYLHIMEQNEM